MGFKPFQTRSAYWPAQSLHWIIHFPLNCLTTTTKQQALITFGWTTWQQRWQNWHFVALLWLQTPSHSSGQQRPCYGKVLGMQQLQLLLLKWDFIACVRSSVWWHFVERLPRIQALRLLLVMANISVSILAITQTAEVILFLQEINPSRLFSYESDWRDLQCFPQCSCLDG